MTAPAGEATITTELAELREHVFAELLNDLPSAEPKFVYDLVRSYPSRPAKGLRPALCLAVCRALGGDASSALNTAVAIELFHNAFLIHDDVQDQSEQRRGGPTLHAKHGVGLAVNVGNMTNLIALRRLFDNRRLLGPHLAWRIFQETELMMRHTLEGQALELGWIQDNVTDLVDDDYYRLCLKKTSWYTCVYPCRVGALVARGVNAKTAKLDRYGWFLGAAFQIQDDILNLVGDYDAYGKEIGGDLYEGKRTLMLIHLLRALRGPERRRVERFLALSREERDEAEVEWLRSRMIDAGSVDHARECAQHLADAARAEGSKAFDGAADSSAREFLLALPSYMTSRNR
jgi:geranylgeranyl diphosphate synthase, type II